LTSFLSAHRHPLSSSRSSATEITALSLHDALPICWPLSATSLRRNSTGEVSSLVERGAERVAAARALAPAPSLAPRASVAARPGAAGEAERAPAASMRTGL